MQTNFSLERIARLVSDLEQELAAAPAESLKVQALLAELEALKQTLAEEDGKLGLEAQLHSTRHHLDQLLASVEGELLRESHYLAEIGRILGLV